MASRGPLKELSEEATCSICLDYITITECGHNFCRACLTRGWGQAAAKASCPHCRGRAEPKSLRPNLQLASFVEITKKLTLQEGKEAGAKGGVCEKHQEPLEVDKAALGAGKGRVCQKHQEPLKLFCEDDKTLICVVCNRSKEHRHHQTLPLEEASQEYKAAMAAGSPMEELREEASCPICLDYFRDPVTIPECGHNFCRACLTQNWGGSRAKASCPQCRGRAQKRKLRPNQQLANIVEIAKRFTLQGERGQACEKHQEPLRFFCSEDEALLCVVCSISVEHKDHEVIPLRGASQGSMAVMAARKERVCQKHQEPLKLFCQDDEALICVVCDRSKEHRDHKTLPLEEASQEYKDQFCNCLEILKKERERIAAYEGDFVKESKDLLKQTKGEKQEMIAKFRQLHLFLEEKEKCLMAWMEEVEKEVARNEVQHLSRFSAELSTLESLIQEMEEKCQQSAGELLQDVRSTLQRYEKRETFENPVTFPPALKWRIWDIHDFNHLLEGVMKQLKDTLDSGLHLQKAKVTLDPDTAHPSLILSDGWKSVRVGEAAQALPNNPERFDQWGIVLGCEGFKAGRQFWEVLVGSEEEWSVGVARKSVRRKGNITFCPEEGVWEVGKWAGSYMASVKNHYPPLALSGELRRIQVCLNYAAGRVAFFNTDQAALLYEFSGASFSGETLLPFFWVRSKGHLKISS